MQKVRIGIVGCGVIGQVHLQRVLKCEQAELVAVADMNQQLAQKTADDNGIPRAYAGDEELIADKDIDAVILALPTGVRGEPAVKALQAGKHVLIEKPAAMNLAELDRIIAAAGDRTAGVCSARYAFNETALAAKAIVADGTLGPLRVIRIRGLGEVAEVREGHVPPVWRARFDLNGGGFLVNWGVYDLDYIYNITGWQLRPHVVLGQHWQVAPHLAAGRVDPDSDAENHVIAMTVCTGGEVILLERGEFMPQPKELVWEIVGQNGALRLNMVRDDRTPMLVHYDTDPETGSLREHVLVETPDAEHDIHLGLLEDFVDAVRNGRQPATSLARARIIQQTTDAIYESARTKTPVILNG